MAYNNLDPIGNERLDYLFGRMTFHIVATLVSPEVAKELKLSDFMAKFGPEIEELSAAADPEAFIAKVKAMNVKMGGKVRKRGDPS